ncbi:MAG: hypothetical protein GYB49_04215 [Alphaproteobacteria bacterium]|nr:hypothetical protein [Alphaproteobacteria bacterium]|tara:strand:+ start:7138 stop:7527 length:390 start_codon:yes stop_codon:yes gene_type:complete
MKTFFSIFWRFLFLISILNYSDTTSIIANGGFNHVALPPEMISQEMVGNAFQSIGWSIVFILSLRRNPLFAPELCYFLGGMLFFDVQTTWTLDMPLPPGFLIWGTIVAGLHVLAGVYLATRRAAAHQVA